MVKQYTEGEVISLEFEKGSFSWSNGLYVVIKQKEDILDICRIDDKGVANRIEGKYSISCTGVNNPAVKRTKMTYKL